MLTKSGAKLMDFGLAKTGPVVNPGAAGVASTMAGSTGNHPITEQGTVVGTYQYMSPEQVEGKEADTRSDIFALGAVLYEMATGRRAFEGKTSASVIAAVMHQDPPPISTVQPPLACRWMGDGERRPPSKDYCLKIPTSVLPTIRPEWSGPLLICSPASFPGQTHFR